MNLQPMMQFLLFASAVCAIGAILVVVCGCKGDRRQLDFQGTMIGLSLLPSFVSFSSYLNFAAFSYLAPGRVMGIATPLALGLLILLAAGRRRSIAANRSDWEYSRIWTLVLLLPLAVFIAAILVATYVDQSNHDISIYLLEASDISKLMKTGTSNIFGWIEYKNPVVNYPNSLSFTVYLAWGFLFESAPGFGSDYIPKLLVGLNHLAVFAAIIGLFARARPRYWGFVAVAFVMCDPIWNYQIAAMSRDSFYIAPTITLLTLLLRGKPNIPQRPVPANAGLFLALFGGLLGHDLGTILVSGVAAGAFVALSLRYKLQVFKILSLWVTGAGILLVTLKTLITYYRNDPGNLGFNFPYYVDPFQQAAFAHNQSFLTQPSVEQVITFLISKNGMLGLFLVLVGAAVITIALRWIKKRVLSASTLWVALLVSLVVCVFIVMVAPIRLAGISLRSAFASNFRYGFGLGLIALALASESLRLVLGYINLAVVPSNLRRCLDVIFSGAVSAWSLTMAATYIPRNWKDTTSRDQASICKQLISSGARHILVDNDGILYPCPHRTVFAYTPEGAQITGATGDKQIAAALDEQQIDAVLLQYSIPTWWSGTYLYKFLKKNWTERDRKDPVVFDRSGR